MITQLELKEHVNYDYETGVFTRLIANSYNVKVGDIAVWREFNLSESEGAGMTLTVDGIVTKEHGKATNTDELKVMGDSITFYRKPVEKVKGKV